MALALSDPLGAARLVAWVLEKEGAVSPRSSPRASTGTPHQQGEQQGGEVERFTGLNEKEVGEEEEAEEEQQVISVSAGSAPSLR